MLNIISGGKLQTHYLFKKGVPTYQKQKPPYQGTMPKLIGEWKALGVWNGFQKISNKFGAQI